ncbi:cytochrome P450 4c21-like [Paramuricea clavata]|uniref:Cytochrome P450 4c21-like n=1 Tax=Paramuricea clavata TaxID=317549 RepID=A0A7D9IG05_PARCT|nr:cytochrome P450 4c21-like [Paramuricea clavata]
MSTLAWNFSSYLIILIATIFFILLWKAVTFVFNQSNVPRPKGNWLTGQLFEIIQSKDVMKTYHQWVKTYGPIVEYRPLGIFGPTNYLVSDADAVKQILVTNSFKYHRPSVGGKLLSHKNVVRANGKEHSRMRKMLNPAFKVNNLKSMVDVFHEKAKLLEKVWNDTICAKNSNDEECKLFVQKDFIRLSFDVLGECVFGYEFNSIEAGNTPVTQAFQDFTTGPNMGANTLTRRLLHFLPFHKRSIKRKFQESLKTTSKVIKQIIDNKQEKQRGMSSRRKDLLDLLLEAVDDETGQGMDEEELHSQLFIFLVAGHDTSSTALSWALYFLAQYPDIQEKLRSEVKETLKEREESWETYESMEYLTAVVNETLRLRPPAPVTRRKVMHDDNILGYNIPTGSVIVFPLYALHRKPEYWTDPENFNPDRFLETDKQNNPNNRFAFLPFSTGPRTCIGYKFALMEIKIVLATLIQDFTFSMIPGMSFEGSLSFTYLYKPKPSLQLLIRNVSE